MVKELNKAELKKINNTGFRHLKKEEDIDLIYMINRLDIEAAEKIIEQIPEFFNTMKEVLKDYKGNLNSIISLNNSSVHECYKMAGCIIGSLEALLDKADLSFEERVVVIEQMKEVQK